MIFLLYIPSSCGGVACSSCCIHQRVNDDFSVAATRFYIQMFLPSLIHRTRKIPIDPSTNIDPAPFNSSKMKGSKNLRKGTESTRVRIKCWLQFNEIQAFPTHYERASDDFISLPYLAIELLTNRMIFLIKKIRSHDASEIQMAVFAFCFLHMRRCPVFLSK